jgi:hypothetical protein
MIDRGHSTEIIEARRRGKEEEKKKRGIEEEKKGK